jgi:ATP-dependent helicase/nuclease subunit A
LGAVDRVTDLAGTVRVADLIVAAVESFDLDLSAAAGGPDEARVLGNALKLARLARDVESAQGGGLPGFLHHLDLQEHFGERQSPAAVVDGRTPAIRVMSIHSAKGLEFPVVAVPGLGSQTGSSNSDRHRLGSGESPYALALALPDDGAGERTTPSFEALKQDAAERDEREDRRLFYVACTRAEKMLILSGAVNLAKPKAGDAMSTWVKWIRRVLGLDEGALTPGETTVHLGSDVKVVVVSHVPPEGEGPVATDVSPAVRAASTAGAPAASAGPEPCGGPAFVMPAEISYTDIATFESCPLKFRAMRSLGLPGVPPDSPLDPLTFGKAVHAVLSIGEGLTGAAREERLAAIARGHRLDAEGRARLDAAVEGFRSSRAAAVLRKADSVSREAPFAVALGDTRLTGFLDAIGWVGDHCTIVDYKTGTGASDDDEALNRRYRRQAECYGLAALVAGADAVEVAFVRVEDLDDDGAAHEVVFAWKQADVDEVRRSVADAAEAIAAGVFKPLDTYQPGACDGCAVAGGLCPVYVPTALDARR